MIWDGQVRARTYDVIWHEQARHRSYDGVLACHIILDLYE